MTVEMTVALSSLIAAAVSFGFFKGAVEARLKNSEKTAGEIKENYIDRFDRLEKKIDRIFDRMDDFMTKEDHDRICAIETKPTRKKK